MASLKLISAYRSTAVLPVFLRTSIRCFSNTPSLPRPPMTQQPPKVSNTAQTDNSVSVTWSRDSENAIRNIESLPMLNPYSGRTVTVNKDIGESLKTLDGILARNKVRLQLRMTERHEKKGYKRRRLESERWRNQFANEVRKKVQLVMKMRDRGA